MPRDDAHRLFADVFGADPSAFAQSPGRVNLIGDHTDYNDGFVLPMGIEGHLSLAFRPRTDRRVVVTSAGANSVVDFDLDDPDHLDGWGVYVQGVGKALAERNIVGPGWDGAIVSTVPSGAGLSSSAALELAVARAFVETASQPWDPVEMALASQAAENDWVGMSCGIMDQLISATATSGNASLIDCRDLSRVAVPLADDVAIAILDTSTRRGLVDSAYNERRSQCEEAAERLGVAMLRDVTLDDLEGADLAATTVRRARHVVSENDRVQAWAVASTAGDHATAGQLMVESHVSLRDDYEVSSPALDAMVDAALATEGCFGARMTGAGFGGCAVALVEAADADRITTEIAGRYGDATRHTAAVYLTGATDGTTLLRA